jgi:hypothetical protein
MQNTAMHSDMNDYKPVLPFFISFMSIFNIRIDA